MAIIWRGDCASRNTPLRRFADHHTRAVERVTRRPLYSAWDLQNQQSLWNVNWFCFKVLPRRFRERTMAEPYLEVVSLVERLHRQFLEIVKLELDGLGIHDINNVQGMMLFNIGDAEMTVGELTLRGCYLGSNVSYNVKKLVENGYLAQERSVHDRRSIHVKLTA